MQCHPEMALTSPEAKEDCDVMKEIPRPRKQLEEMSKENLFLKKPIATIGGIAFFAKEID